MVARLTGQSIERVEDGRLLTGQGRFIGGLQRPGMYHAAFVRSPIGHGVIASIDTSRARAAAGVVAVFTVDDLAATMAMPMSVMGPPSLKTAPYWPLAKDRVRLVGDPVALVVATSAPAAADAAELVEVAYEPLPAVTTLAGATAAGGELVWPEFGTNVIADDVTTYGRPYAEVAANAARTIARRHTQHRYGHAPIEPRGAVASYETFGRTFHYDMANKRPHALKLQFSNLLGLPFPSVHVRSGDIGGAFGSKGQTTREDIALGAAAKLLGHTIKWVETRTENLQTAGQAREEDFDIEAAVDARGRIVGIKAHMTIDVGAYPMLPFPQTLWPSIVRMLLPNALTIEAYEFRATVAVSNKASYIAYRAPWLIETLARERLLEDLARELDVDPIEIRRRNVVTAADQPRQMVTGVSMNGVTVRECLERAAALAELPAFRARQAAARQQGGKLLGIGFSTFIENAPGPPDLPGKMGFDLPSESAWARIEPTGDVVIQTWQVNHGQGHETTLAQVVADEMGVPMSKVRIEWGSSDNTPFNMMSTGGSRSATMGAGSAKMAARAVKQLALQAAAHLLEANPDDLEIVDGDISVRGTPAKKIGLPDVARAAWFAPSSLPAGMRQGLEAQIDFKVPEGAGWVSACHVCWIEIDVDTGAIEIPRYLVVEDCGELINPAIVDGQIRGGVAQGIAATLFEKHVYDSQGQLLTSSFGDYLVPAASEIPKIEIDHYHGAELHEVNSRGVGEGGTLGTPAAVLNAFADAVAHLGVSFTDTYLPPQRVRELLAAAQVLPAGVQP